MGPVEVLLAPTDHAVRWGLAGACIGGATVLALARAAWAAWWSLR